MFIVAGKESKDLLFVEVLFVEFEIVDLHGKRARIANDDLLFIAGTMGQDRIEDDRCRRLELIAVHLTDDHLRFETDASTQNHHSLAALVDA